MTGIDKRANCIHIYIYISADTRVLTYLQVCMCVCIHAHSDRVSKYKVQEYATRRNLSGGSSPLEEVNQAINPEP